MTHKRNFLKLVYFSGGIIATSVIFYIVWNRYVFLLNIISTEEFKEIFKEIFKAMLLISPILTGVLIGAVIFFNEMNQRQNDFSKSIEELSEDRKNR